jgi:exoribonuclease R
LEKKFYEQLKNEEEIFKINVFSIDKEKTRAIDDAISFEEYKVKFISVI